MLHSAKILRWLDGDTCEVDVNLIDLGFKIRMQDTVRVYGINAPEIHSTDPKEKAAGEAAKLFAEGLAPVGSTVEIQTAKANKEKFGRWLAVITIADGRDFAHDMIAAGHAKPYFGGPRGPDAPAEPTMPKGE